MTIDEHSKILARKIVDSLIKESTNNTISPTEANCIIIRELNKYFSENIKTVCSYVGASSTGPDPVTEGTWRTSFRIAEFYSTEFIQWSNMLSDVILEGSSITGFSDNLIELKGELPRTITKIKIMQKDLADVFRQSNSAYSVWEFIIYKILTTFVQYPSEFSISASHLSSSGTATVVQNILN